MSFPSGHRDRAEPSSSSSYLPQSCREFTLHEIKLATHNFDESRLLGSGGFAKVYRGTITYEGRLLDVAVKRLTPGSNEETLQFWYEVALISKLRHPHLVSQIGYFSDGHEMIIVYDYMPRGTLYHRLHNGGLALSWVRRLKICLETARGLEYLHSVTDTKSMVLHLDVKSLNILLTSNWEAKLSDFGLSKVRPADSAYVTEHVGGTLGYVDPEFQQNGKASRKTDVFAFGVVMFELLCGKKAYPSIDGVRQFLRSWAQETIKKGRLKQIIDPILEGRISSDCLKKFALLADRCLHKRPEQRPAMADVVKDLESILALQEEADSKSLVKIFGAKAYSAEESVEPITLKSLDRYLYTAGGEDRIVSRFNFSTLVQATENFSEANKVSSDGYFEFMYKGRLQNGQAITIAKFLKNAYEECKKEASILVEIENENVIPLLGYCIDRPDVYLLYDFALNATLDSLFFDPLCDALDWNKRHKIILGVARGLVYLHNKAPSPITHFDMKPDNILLDQSFQPKLSGFGVAMMVSDLTPMALVYEARVLEETWLKDDVYSFGTLVLNIVTGKKAYGPKREVYWLVNHVQENWLQGTLLDIIDPRINDVDSSIMLTNFIEIGLLCVQPDDEVRPTMEEVVGFLLGTLSLTLPVSEMLARMTNREPPNSDPVLTNREPPNSYPVWNHSPDHNWIVAEDSDTGEAEEFISELGPR